MKCVLASPLALYQNPKPHRYIRQLQNNNLTLGLDGSGHRRNSVGHKRRSTTGCGGSGGGGGGTSSGGGSSPTGSERPSGRTSSLRAPEEGWAFLSRCNKSLRRNSSADSFGAMAAAPSTSAGDRDRSEGPDCSMGVRGGSSMGGNDQSMGDTSVGGIGCGDTEDEVEGHEAPVGHSSRQNVVTGTESEGAEPLSDVEGEMDMGRAGGSGVGMGALEGAGQQRGSGPHSGPFRKISSCKVSWAMDTL